METTRVTIRTDAEIGTNFPDDTVWVNDHIVLLGGKNVAVAIGEILARLGAEVSEPILEDCGWALNLSYKGREPRCLVQDGGDFVYFIMKDRLGARGDPAGYVELIVQLNGELHWDPRFHDIRWYHSDDRGQRHGPPSSSPVD